METLKNFYALIKWGREYKASLRSKRMNRGK